MFSSKNQFLTGAGGYQVQRSVRFRTSASGYFSRTPASAGTRTTWTWSGWVKRGVLGVRQGIFISSDSGTTSFFGFEFRATDVFAVFDSAISTSVPSIVTTQVFRDPSAWYHIVLALDTTQATAANRVLLWINGVAVTSFSSATYPALNATPRMNGAFAHALGSWTPATPQYFDGYMAEVHFVDGQALTPASFGQLNSVGVWSPIDYLGTYGTNGFNLNFSDNSASTATTIGKDYSGNGNNWTPNNISVTAGVTYDSMLDVPTNWGDGGNGRGNYCVLNPLIVTTAGLPADGNLKFSGTNATSWSTTNGTMAVSSGKWYWEQTITTIGGNAAAGISDPSLLHGTFSLGGKANDYGYHANTGQKQNNATLTTYGATYTTGDVIGVALDMDAGTLTFYKNNVSQGVAFSGLSGSFAPGAGNYNSGVLHMNFGQRPFAYTPPTGHVALNTQNLPTPAIANGAAYMAATTYTGTGAARSVDNSVNSLSFQPDFVWIKTRSTISSNILFDSLRGTLNYVSSNSNTAAATLAGSLTAFNSNGFSLGTDSNTNGSGTTFVGWQWLAGAGSTSSNTNGSITSTVSVNATAGFSVVTYTGTGANATVGHGLGVAPKMILVKKRSGIQSWSAYHASLANTQYLVLDTTAAVATLATMWNSTTPTSSVFSVGTDGNVNTSAATYVAYCFSEVAGYSKIGSYTGNGSADGPFVYCGFRPKFVMFKRTDVAANWLILDTSRNTYNVVDLMLEPNLSDAEATGLAGTNNWDALSNGFKVRGTGALTNTSSGSYIFMAFAENPFKYSLAR